MKRVLIVLILLLFVSSCAPYSPDQADVGGTETYTNTAYGYSIDFPAGWIIAEAAAGAAVSVISDGDRFANIVIEVEQASGTLDELWITRKGNLESAYVLIGTETLQGSETTFAGQDAYDLDFTYKLGYDIKSRTTFIVKDQYAYMINYQAEEEVFDEYLSEAETSLSTFQFL